MMKKIIILLLILIFSIQGYAQEVITDFSDESLVILNRELNKLNRYSLRYLNPETINIASYLYADEDTGLWLGNTAYASAPFRVSTAGALYASSATLTGSITATSGAIGGWTIGAGALTAGTGASAVGLAPGTYPFYAGNSAPASAPFSVSAAGAIVATSGTIGGWSLTGTSLASSSAPSTADILLDKANGIIRVGNSTSAYLYLDGANKKISTSDFASGALGSGWALDDDTAEFNNIRARGKFTTAVFEKETISSVGGNLLVSDSDLLNADMTASDASVFTILGDTTFAVGDILRIKDGVEDEFILVTGIGSAPTYTVTRDMDGTYTANNNPTWKKGTAVINYGCSGEGLIYMTASESNSPYISVLTHAGAPWNTTTTEMRMGNLNGFLDYGTDLYGVAIGSSDSYLKYDSTNGLRIKGSITVSGGTAIQTFAQDAIPTSIIAGDLWIDTNDSNKLYRAGSAGANEIAAGEWVLYQDGTIATAQSTANTGVTNAATAQSTANSKVVTFVQAATPTSIAVGDLWADSDDSNKLYRASAVGSGNWVIVRDSAATTLDTWRHTSDTTRIDGGDIYTGSITADKITVTQLDAVSTNTGTLTVDEYIQSSDYVANTTGFKISNSMGIEVNTGTIKTSTIVNYPNYNWTAGNDIVSSQTNSGTVPKSTSYVIGKAFKINRAGVLRVKFDMSTEDPVDGRTTAYSRIYRNGVAVGTEQTHLDNTPETKSEDISGWSIGDFVQLYSKTSDFNFGIVIANFSIGVNEGSAYVESLTY